MYVPRLTEVFILKESSDEDEKGKVIPFRKPVKAKAEKVPLSSVFKGKPPLTIKPQWYKKKVFSWGEHRTIEIGATYTVIISKQDWWKISNLKPGKGYRFADETRNRWDIERDADGKSFKVMNDGSEKAVGSWDEMMRALE